MPTVQLFDRLMSAEPGTVLIMVRKGFTGYVDVRFELVVERVAPTRLFVSQNRYIDKKTGELKPRYLDYTTTVESIRESETL